MLRKENEFPNIGNKYSICSPFLKFIQVMNIKYFKILIGFQYDMQLFHFNYNDIINCCKIRVI